MTPWKRWQKIAAGGGAAAAIAGATIATFEGMRYVLIYGAIIVGALVVAGVGIFYLYLRHMSRM